MTKFPQLHLIEVTTDDVVRFCRQKYGIVPNSKVIERIVVSINNHEDLPGSNGLFLPRGVTRNFEPKRINIERLLC